MKKTATLFLALIAALAAGAQSIKVIGGNAGNYMLLSVSPNGQYAAGINSATNNSILWNINSGEVLETSGQESVNCVNNQGVMVGYQGEYPVKILPDLTVEQLLTDTMGMANAISDDGLICGATMDESYTTHACVWKDGKTIMLPEPTSEEAGTEVNGTSAKFVSGDGKVIAGYVQDNMSTWPLIIWRLQPDGSYKVIPTCKAYYNDGNDATNQNPYYNFEATSISHNGKWIGLQVTTAGEGGLPTAARIARYDIDADTIQVATLESIDGNEENTECLASGISDDGTLLGIYNWSLMYGRKGLLWQSGKAKAELLANLFKEIEELSVYDKSSHTPVAITPDDGMIVGFGMNADYTFEGYCLTTKASTGIHTSSDAVATGSTTYYDISGRRLPSLQGVHGLVIERNVKAGSVALSKRIIK